MSDKEVKIHNLKEQVKLLKEQLEFAVEPLLVRQLTMSIADYEAQIRKAEGGEVLDA